MRDDFFDELELDDGDNSLARLAYIKVIDVDEARALGARIPSEIKLPADVKLYALHAADGTTIGITDNWAAAYGAAVQNNLLPVSVH
jgi:hypothetical protein